MSDTVKTALCPIKGCYKGYTPTELRYRTLRAGARQLIRQHLIVAHGIYNPRVRSRYCDEAVEGW